MSEQSPKRVVVVSHSIKEFRDWARKEKYHEKISAADGPVFEDNNRTLFFCCCAENLRKVHSMTFHDIMVLKGGFQNHNTLEWARTRVR